MQPPAPPSARTASHASLARHLSRFAVILLGGLASLCMPLPLAAQPILGSASSPGSVPGSTAAPLPGASRPSRDALGSSSRPNASPGDSAYANSPSSAAPLSESVAQAAPYYIGPIALRPHLVYRYTHGDGVASQPGRQYATALHEASPGFLAELGGAWSFDYTAHQSWYSRSEFKDTLGHNLLLQGSQSVGTWGLAFSQTYSKSETPLIETARQTRQENASTQLKGARLLGPRTQLAIDLSRNAQKAASFGDSTDWASIIWLNQQFEQHLSLGLGAGTNYVDISSRPDFSSQRLMIQATWQLTKKFSLIASGGVESRKDRATGTNSRSPNYTAQLDYQPFDYTRLSLSAGRSSSVSYFNNQLNDASQWSVSLNQRLLGKFQLSTSYNEQRSRYLAAVALLETSRSDSQKGFSVRLGATLRTRGSVGVSYQRRTNDSSLEGYSLGSDQIGVDLGWRY